MKLTDDMIQLLKKLRLSGILETLDARLLEATDTNLSHTEFLFRLLRDEVERRDGKQLDQRLRRACFEQVRTVEDFDFAFNPSIPRAKVLELANVGFVARRENVLLVGIGELDAGGPDAHRLDGNVDGDVVPCGRQIPARPTSGSGDGPDVVFAFKDIVVNQASDPLWYEIGFNLDGECTEAGITDYLCAPPGASGPLLDGPNGVDNMAGERVFPAIQMFAPSFEADLRNGMARGRTFLVRVRGWNGEPDDSRVQATLAQSVGRSGLRREDMLTLPQWDGQDSFDVSRPSFVAGDPARPIIVDDDAYVVNGRLVFALPDRAGVLLPFTAQLKLVVKLSDGWFTGVITEPDPEGNPGFLTMEDTVLTGRWSPLDVSEALAGIGACASTPERIALDSLVADQVDVRSDQTSLRGQQCDAVSVAIGLTGYQAIWGDVASPSEFPNPCPLE